MLAGALLLGNSGPPVSAVSADAATPHVEAVQQWQAELSAATPQAGEGFQTSEATVNGQTVALRNLEKQGGLVGHALLSIALQ